MLHKVFRGSIFSDARIWALLKRIDEAEAAACREVGCPACDGALHSATYPRKPHGLAAELRSDARRFSFCCNRCRGRVTPPSVRFFGRRFRVAPLFLTLDIAVIDVPVLRLDHRLDRERLLETVERVGPRLVVLDPLVRLHGVDENTVAEIAPILGFLRDLQRRLETAVLLVHHARKSGATRPGQALRGSSELHAWGDSNLYLRRHDKQIVMTVEHRAAPGLNDIEIELADDGRGPALRLRQAVADEAAPEPETAEQRIVRALADADTPTHPSRSARSASVPQPGPQPSRPPSRR